MPAAATAERKSEDLWRPFIDALPVTGASISVFDASGRQSSVGSSDVTAGRLDELQFELGEGPQWEAVRTGTRVLIPDVSEAANSAWPIFAAAVGELDVRAIFAFPLAIGAATVGAVGLYRRTPGGLTDRDLGAASAMASAVAALAVDWAVQSAGDDGAAESAKSPAMRREVHQATGMVLVQLDTSATIAYSRLQAHSFATGRTLQDVARDVVGRVLNFRSLPK